MTDTDLTKLGREMLAPGRICPDALQEARNDEPQFGVAPKPCCIRGGTGGRVATLHLPPPSLQADGAARRWDLGVRLE